MNRLPATERILLGPGPSMISPRVMRALSAPVLSHLDPEFVLLLDHLRTQLAATFKSSPGSLAIAMSGTGTSGMEASIANLVQDRTRVLSIVTGYFGERLAEMSGRYGATVTRLDVDWGRACDPQAVRDALRRNGADVVTLVHAETSTGVLNPVQQIAAVIREHGAIAIVDAVTSLGGHPLDLDAWGVDACYSCTQKCIGAPSGLAPIAFSREALDRRVKCRSFYLDLGLLEAYWVDRKYHHTMSSTLIYALSEALASIEEEGLEARWARHHRHHLALAAGLNAIGLDLLPALGDRLWTLNAVRVPEGTDESGVRRTLLRDFNIEIGAGLGPLAGKIWRVGLMGASSSPTLIVLFLSALEQVLRQQGHKLPTGSGAAAAIDALAREAPAPTAA